MKTTAYEPSGVLVLHKTLDVLEALRRSPTGLSLAELTAELGMPKATIFRILATLESRAYLDRTAEGDYRIGRKLAGLDTESTSWPGSDHPRRASGNGEAFCLLQGNTESRFAGWR